MIGALTKKISAARRLSRIAVNEPERKVNPKRTIPANAAQILGQ
jgi:hypothetical protein